MTFTNEELEGEIWEFCKNYEHNYVASTLGRLKKISTNRIITGALKDGYYQVGLTDSVGYKLVMIHRLIADTFIPNSNNKPFINHKDSVRNNNRVSNLEWCTPKENSIHAHATSKGRFKMPSGVDKVNSKLTREDVLYIRLNPNMLNQLELSKKFGVNQSVISKVRNFIKYKDVA